ncbi:MAG: hypothetical protein IKC07_02220 [Clostridia bacterium]|nr:hypothetical protein [Clostridia bacterium]
MIKNARKIINSKVYESETGKYLGKISDIAFSDGELKGYYMSGDSIVPLLSWIFPSAVTSYKKGKIFVSGVSHPQYDGITFKKNISRCDFISGRQKIGIGKDMLFDFETGEIEGFLYSENIFRKPNYLDINKIAINGKNITVKN